MGSRVYKLHKINLLEGNLKNENRTPSCKGKTLCGFKDKKTGAFSEVMFIRTPADLESFRSQYNIRGEIKKIY